MCSRTASRLTFHDERGELARLVSRSYDLRHVHLTLVREGDNSVFRVESASGARYALRLHSSKRHSAAMLTSELDWLDVLARTAHLAVPQPVRTAAASWVASFAVDPHPPVLGTLLTWLDGEALPEGEEFDEVEAEQVGALLAGLHAQAEQFCAPPLFERPRYDAQLYLASGRRLRHTLSGVIERERLERFGTLLTRLVETLGPLEDLPGGFGLIHGDVHPGNFLRRGRHLALVDFDRCGWGPFLLDVATADLALGPQERDALIASYTRRRALPPDSLTALAGLRVLAAVDNLAFLSERPQEVPFVVDALPTVEAALAAHAREQGEI